MSFNPKIKVHGTEGYEPRDCQTIEMLNIPIEYANGLRRALHADAPSLTIDKVFFLDNKTSLTEEYIAQRLGMVPLWVEPKFFETLQYFYRAEDTSQNIDFAQNIVN